MEACFTTLQPNDAHLVKVGKGGVDNGFWGQKIRRNLINCKKDLKKSSFLRSEFGKGRMIKRKGGIQDHLTKQAMTHPGSVLSNNIADPNSVAAVILGRGFEINTRDVPFTRENLRAWADQLISLRHTTIRKQNEVPISNCINSGINKIFILTQLTHYSHNKYPLLRKLGLQYRGFVSTDGCIELLGATQAQEEIGKKWFQGTTDALRQITLDGKNKNTEHIMVFSGGHLYGMDCMDFVQKHISTGADISVLCKVVDDSLASDSGLLKMENSGRITHFAVKPTGSDLKAMQVDTAVLGLSPEQAIQYPYIASTGIYVFKIDVLLKLLMPRLLPISVDFGSDIIASAVRDHNMQALLF